MNKPKRIGKHCARCGFNTKVKISTTSCPKCGNRTLTQKKKVNDRE